jgi:hypothetical protein
MRKLRLQLQWRCGEYVWWIDRRRSKYLCDPTTRRMPNHTMVPDSTALRRIGLLYRLRPGLQPSGPYEMRCRHGGEHHQRLQVGLSGSTSIYEHLTRHPSRVIRRMRPPERSLRERSGVGGLGF